MTIVDLDGERLWSCTDTRCPTTTTRPFRDGWIILTLAEHPGADPQTASFCGIGCLAGFTRWLLEGAGPR